MQVSPHVRRQFRSLLQLGIVEGPRIESVSRRHLSQNAVVEPRRNPLAGSVIANRPLVVGLEHPPGDDVHPVVVLGVEDDLGEDSRSVLVVIVVDLDQVDPVAGDGVVWRGVVGQNGGERQ